MTNKLQKGHIIGEVVNIKFDKENQDIYIDDFKTFAPTHIINYLNSNTMCTDWEDFKFSDFKKPDYTHLMELYRDCGVNWSKYVYFFNMDSSRKRKGKIVVGELAKNMYIFYLSFQETTPHNLRD